MCLCCSDKTRSSAAGYLDYERPSVCAEGAATFAP